MQLKAAKLAAIFSRLHSALRTPRSALALALCVAWPQFAVADSLANYTVLEYIDSVSTGDASIKLDDFQLDYANCVETKVRFNDVGGNQAIFCERCSQSDTYTLFKTSDSYGSSSTPSFRLDYGGESAVQGYDIVVGKDYVLETTPKDLYVNGASKTWSGRSEKSGVVGGGNHLLLFAENNNDRQGDVPGGGCYARMRMYYFRVYADKTKQSLRLNLVPARSSSGTIGMYDTVNNRFYGPYSSTQTFSTGSTDTFLAKLAAFAAPRSGIDPLASGGDYVYRDGADYVHVFTSPMSGDEKMFFKVNADAKAKILVIGGGGAGGAGAGQNCLGSGGGGAGGYIEETCSFTAGMDCTITVGGAGHDTSITSSSMLSYLAQAGGGGGVLEPRQNAGSGGSGGGGYAVNSGEGGSGGASNAVSPEKGYAGAKGGGSNTYTAGGGGGAGSAGSVPNGGLGAFTSITGFGAWYCGGGGGGVSSNAKSRGLGQSGGGDGAYIDGSGATSATTPGSGGGGGFKWMSGGSGMQGIVVVRVRAGADPIPFANFIKLSFVERVGTNGKGTIDGDTNIQLSEVAFFDAQMKRINQGLTAAANEADYKSTPNTYWARKGNSVASSMANFANMFDGNSGTKFCGPASLSTSDNRCELVVYMHLSQESNVFLYNLMSGNDTDGQTRRAPIAWTVQVSADGENWTDFDSRTVSDTAGDAALTGRSTWYNGGGTGSQPIAFYGRVQSNPMVSSMANVSTAYSVGDDYVMVFANANAAASFTLAVPPPVVASLSSSAVAATSATVTLDVSSLGDETDLCAVLRWGTTENCTEGAKILGAVAVGTPLVENLTGLVPGTNYHAKVEFVRDDHTRVASASVLPTSFATPVVAASAYADILSVTGAARSEVLSDGSTIYVFTDTSAAASFTIAKGGLARLLVVGGGGAGGFYGYHAATGGGGGGGVIDQVLELESGTYKVTVGAGGVFDDASINSKWSKDNETHYNGSPSSVRLDGASDDVLSALGGGGGANMDGNGGEGANGGGGSTYHKVPNDPFSSGGGGLGTVGFDGGAAWGPLGTSSTYKKMHMGGGGAGAGGFGGSVTDENGRGTGGIGLYSSILDLPETDDVAWFGGGGAGGAGVGSEDDLRTEMVAGGRGGGASSREWSGKDALANPGTPGTGGGGSGVVQHYGNSVSKGTANGGSGIVVLRIYGNMCVPVTLNANGGSTAPNPATVTATPGQEMPQLEARQILTGTRTGYTFQGYSAESWTVTYMTGDAEQDVCTEGECVFAKLVGSGDAMTVNGVEFTTDLADATKRSEVMGLEGIWSKANGAYLAEGQSDGDGFGQILADGIFRDGLSTANVTLKGLTVGHAYLFQIFVHDGRGSYCLRTVSADGDAWFKYGNSSGGEERYGVSMIRRFVATGAEETVKVYFNYSSATAVSAQINAVQLRDLGTESALGKYYNADGSSARTYPANGPTELFAIWQPKTTTITFDGNGGNLGGTTSLTATYGQPLPDMHSPLPTRPGYAFVGCKAQNPIVEYYNAQGKGTKPWDREDASVTLFAQWGVINYTVQIDANGGTGGTSTFSSNYGAVPLVNAPTRTGFSFAGWKVTGVDGSSAKCGASSGAVTTPIVEGGVYGGGASSFYFKQLRESAGTVTLTAQWAANEYAITYNGLPDGATHSNPATYTIETETIVFTAPSAVSGYKFTGWSPTSIAKGSTGNQTVTASYLTMVEKPTAATGLVYNGTELTGVAAATGYTVTDGKKTNAGDYTATVTLSDGYCWPDGSRTDATVDWSIAKATIAASAADVEKEYDGVAAQIAVTVTSPATGYKVTYSATEDGEYTETNPSYSEFGVYRVYWKVTAENYEEKKGSAVVSIAKKAAGKYVRLVITKCKGNGRDNDFQFNELELYDDDSGANCISAGLTLADGLADLKKNAGTCYSFPTNCYGNQAQNASKLFDNDAGSGSKLCCLRNSTSADSTDAHVEIYMHLSDAPKVIRSYNLKSADDANDCSWRSPTAWRLEVSSDCERWTVIDEKTVADTAGNIALSTKETWYGRDGSGNKKPYPINLDYVPMEVLETNPYAEGTEEYKNVVNYVQIVGFRLEADDVVTAKVRYNDQPKGSKFEHIWDTVFSQRDATTKGSFAVFRRFGDDLKCLRLDYGDGGEDPKKEIKVDFRGECEFVASAAGLKTNGVDAIKVSSAIWTSVPDNSLLLFASDDWSKLDGVPSGNQAYLKCHYFKVENSATDSTLRLDLMPASNTVSHAQGLYDRVSGNFYPLQDASKAGETAFSATQPKVVFSKELTAVKDDEGWDELPILREVAYDGTYLTSIPNYWQQEWGPSAVNGLGEYRQVLRGQGPYKGAVTNVYAVYGRVTLNANATGVTPGATNSVLVLPGKALPNITGAGALPTRVGYDFVGYFDDATAGTRYYDADGTCAEGVTYPTENGPAELYAHWEQIKFHVIRPDGPEIAVDWEWLKKVFGSVAKEQYQKYLFETNSSGVVAWQAYVLGAAATPEAVANMAIVEETVQNNDPETVTIRLKDMPDKSKRPDGTGCTVKFSLYSATTTGAFANGGGDPVDGCERKDESTFEAPLSVLTDESPVRYYQIRVHFTFESNGRPQG